MWEVVVAGVALEAAQLTAIVVLAKQAGYWKAIVKDATRDLEKALRIQREQNKPLPTDPDDIRALMDDS